MKSRLAISLMTRLLFFFGLLLLPILLFSQKNTGFSVVGGIDHLHRTLYGVYSVEDNNPNRHFRLGVTYDQRFDEKWWFVTGLRFTQFRFDSGEIKPPVNLQYAPRYFNGTRLTLIELEGGYRWRASDYYAEIPLMFRCFPRTKGRFYLEFGGAVNVYLTTLYRLDISSEQRRYWSRDGSGTFDHVLSNVRLGVGWQWKTTRNQHLIIQPTFRYFFQNNIRYQMLSIGFEVGYRW